MPSDCPGTSPVMRNLETKSFNGCKGDLRLGIGPLPGGNLERISLHKARILEKLVSFFLEESTIYSTIYSTLFYLYFEVLS